MGERREVRLRPGPGRSGLSSGRRAALAVVAAAIAASVCVEVSAPVVAAAADARGFATVPATVLGDGAAVQAGVVADGRGGMYSVSRDTILGGTSILFRRSDDGGTNWSAPRIVTPRDYNWFAPSVAVRIVDDAVEVWVTAVRYECPPAGSFCGYRGGLFLLDGSGSVRESWDTPFGVAYEPPALSVDPTGVLWGVRRTDGVAAVVAARPRRPGAGAVAGNAWRSFAGVWRMEAARSGEVAAIGVARAPGSIEVVTIDDLLVGAGTLRSFTPEAGERFGGLATTGNEVHVLTLAGRPGGLAGGRLDPTTVVAEVRVRTATVRGIFLGEFGAPVTVATTPDYGWGANARIAAGGGTVAAVWEDPTSRSLLTAVSGSRGAAFGPASPVPGSIAAENPTLEATVRDPSTVPVARFSWSVAEGYRDVDGDGAPDPRVTALGADPQVRVTLDGCGSVAGPGLFDAIARYRWFIDGAEVAAENSCRIERMVTADVEHAVRLVVVRAGDEVEARSDQRIRPRLTVVVAMGDGVAAGEGNPLVPSTFDPSLDVDSIVDANLRPAEWQDRACHRSASAGAALAARRLEQSDRHSAVAFFHLACSGASIRSGDVVDPAGENRAATGGVLDPYQGIEPTAPTDDEGAARPSQLDQLGTLLAASGQDVDALLLSVGAADVRLDEVVRGCLSSQIGEGDGCNTPGARSAFDRRFAVLPDRFVELADALAASRPELAAHPERVVLTGYADPTPDRLGATNLRCVADAEVVGQIAAGVAAVTELIGKIGSFAPPARAFLEVLGKAAEVTALLVGGGNGLITDTEARWLSTSVYGGVNGVVRDAAAGYGWRFAGAPSAAFARAGYCSDDSRRVVRLGESLWGQAGVEGAFQPNGAGQGAYGDLLARQLALLLPPDDLAVDGSEDDAVLIGATGEYVLTFTGRADPGGPARDRLVVTDLAVRGATLETTAARRIDEVVAAPARFTGTWWQGRGVAADDRGAVVTWTQVATGPLGDTWRSLVGRAYIGRPGVAVEAVTLVQAPDNPLRLAAGRETVVRARLRARLAGPTAVPVEVTVFDGAGDVYGATHSVTLVEGLNDVVLPPGALPRPEADAVWGATVSVVDPGTGVTDLSAGSDDSLTFAAVPVAATRPISMLFAPVDGTGATCAETSTIATRAVPYARAALPVPDDGVRAAFTASALTGPGGCPAVPGTEQTKAGVLAALHDLDRLARLAGVDAVVGTVPTHWLMDTDPDSDPWGVALLGAPGNPMRGMLVESGTFDNVVTHEFAHLLGSDHSVSGDVPGLWVSRRATRQGPDYLRLGATSTRWVSPATYDATLDALGGSAPPVPDGAGPAVRLSGTIAPDGTDPVLGPWLAAAAPDPATPSRLEAVMLDAAGDELAAEPLPLAAAGADYAGPGPGPDEPEPLGYVFARAVPLAPGTATIRLDFDGTPVATRAVSATAPSVTVTAPTPGTVLATGGEVTVVWETVDPDPDPTLSHSVLLSPDGGTTWRPVATDIDASTLTFPLPAGITGDAVRVRVVSSDGVRSGVGEAGPFSVRSVRRGPERIAYTELQSALECQTGLGCDAGIHTAAPDGTDDREVLAKTASPRFAPYEPDWSPDGRRLAFAALADVAVGGAPPYDEPYYRRDIWVSDGDGANRVRITRAIESPLRPGYSTPLEFNCPDWSPDGTRISALAGLGLGEVHPYFVVSMAIDGSDLRFHGRLPARARQCPRWSPDGSMLALPYTYSTFTVPADDRPFRPDGQAWISDGSSPARNDTVVVTFPTSGSSYSATGTVFASIIGQLNSAPTLGAAWETSDTLIVAVSEGLRCGLIRVGSGVPVDDWVMDCPDPRIPNLAGTSLLRIQQFNPVGPHFAPDGRIAFTSGWYEAGSAYTFAATLCTIPADSVSAVPTLANPSFPGLSCLTYPGQTSGLPLNGALRGRREVDWSAGPVIDDDGGGGGGSGPELFLPDAAADPGGPYVLDEDTDGLLDGSASALEATAAGFAWDLDDDGEYDDAVGRQPTVRFTDAGTYPIGLRVTAGPETAFARSEVMVRAVAPVVEVPERQFSLADRATSLGPFRYRDEGTGTHVARIDVGGETFTGVVDGGSVTATVLLPAGEHAGTLTVCDAPTEPCSSVPIVIEGEERPVLSGVAPETVGAAGGAPVTLVGRHLAGTTQVVVGAQTVSATGVGPVTFTAPPGTAGSSAVVTVPGADGEATLYYADLAAVDQDLRTPRDTEILVTLEALDAVAGERVAAVHEVTTVPVHGELVTPGPGGLDDSSAVTTVADSVLYRPPVGFVGTDEFRVRVLGDARTATIRIAVGNAAPVVGADTVRVPVGQVTEVDTAVLLGNDVDPDADSSPARPSRAAAGGTGLEIAAVFAPSGMVGAVWLDAEGKLYFAAPEGASGETEFEYVAADPAGETNTGSVTVEFDGGGSTTTTTTVPVSTTSTTSTVPASTTSTTVAAPSTTAPGGSPTTVPVVVDPVRPDGSLPRTGAGVGTAVRTALVLAGFGIAFVASARKRRRTG